MCIVNSENISDKVEEVRKFAQDEEIDDGQGGRTSINWAEHIKVVLNVEKECKHFTEWHRGFTPKEHQEMIDRKWILEYQERCKRR